MAGNEKELGQKLIWRKRKLGAFTSAEIVTLFKTCFPEVSKGELKRIAKGGGCYVWFKDWEDTIFVLQVGKRKFANIKWVEREM